MVRVRCEPPGPCIPGGDCRLRRPDERAIRMTLEQAEWKSCGHPKTPGNTYGPYGSGKYGRCKICNKYQCAKYYSTDEAKELNRKRKGVRFRRWPDKWLKCDHPRTPENSYRHVDKKMLSGYAEQCLMCIKVNAPSRSSKYRTSEKGIANYLRKRTSLRYLLYAIEYNARLRGCR